MNKNQLEDFISKTSDFLQADEKHKIVTKMEAVLRHSEKMGLNFSLGYPVDSRNTVPKDIAARVQIRLKRWLNQLIDAYEISATSNVYYRTPDGYTGFSFSSKGMIFKLALWDEENFDGEYYIFVLNLVMALLGVKAVRKCGSDSCQRYMFLTRPNKKYCHVNCRQRAFQQTHEAKLARSKRYQQKKGGKQ